MLFCNILHAQQIDPDALSLKKGIKINGGLGLSSVYYSSNGVASYQPDPFTWFATGNLNISLFGINTPFSFSYSNAHAQYTQPFNRLRILPKYKWVRLYLGTSSMNFSNYTLAGYTFNGYGVELTPGRIDGLYIRLGEDLQSAEIIYFSEAKQFAQDKLTTAAANGSMFGPAKSVKLSKSNPATGLPQQMTDDWLEYVGGKIASDASLTADRRVPPLRK